MYIVATKLKAGWHLIYGGDNWDEALDVYENSSYKNASIFTYDAWNNLVTDSPGNKNPIKKR